MITEDNEVMDEVLKTFENLQNVTKKIIRFFRKPSHHKSIEQRFVADTCGELNVAFNQAMSMVCKLHLSQYLSSYVVVTLVSMLRWFWPNLQYKLKIRDSQI